MSLLDGIMSGVGALTGISQDILNYGVQNRNLKNMQDVLNYQKQVQGTTWKREDTAVQRRVADLKAAGLNPVLAAGSAASTSAPIQVTAPRREAVNISGGIDKASMALAVMSAMSDISRTRAQNKLLDIQANKTALEAKGVMLDNWRMEHDNKYYADYGIPSSGGGITKDILNAFEAIRSKSGVLSNTSVPFLDKVLETVIPGKSKIVPGRWSYPQTKMKGKAGGW